MTLSSPRPCSDDGIPQFGLGVQLHGDEVRIAVAGEIDCATAPLLGACLELVARETDAPAVVVDLSRVTFAGCAAVGVLASAHDRLAANQRALAVRNVGPAVLPVFTLTGVETLIEAASTFQRSMADPSARSSIQALDSHLRTLTR